MHLNYQLHKRDDCYIFLPFQQAQADKWLNGNTASQPSPPSPADYCEIVDNLLMWSIYQQGILCRCPTLLVEMMLDKGKKG